MKNTTIFAIMALMILGVVASVSAATPAAVTGTVYGPGNTTISGATVTVTCNSVTEPSVFSDIDGSYYVIFNETDCGYNTPVTVSAVKGSESGTNTGLTCANAEDCEIPVALVDVSIPEFGVIAGAFALLAGIGIVAYRRK